MLTDSVRKQERLFQRTTAPVNSMRSRSMQTPLELLFQKLVTRALASLFLAEDHPVIVFVATATRETVAETR